MINAPSASHLGNPVISLYNKSPKAPIMNLYILYKIFVKSGQVSKACCSERTDLHVITGLTNGGKLHTIIIMSKKAEKEKSNSVSGSNERDVIG